MQEQHIRKPNRLFPKMFRTFTVYIFVTFMVFFGYVQLFGDVGPVVLTLPVLNTDANEESVFGSFVNSFGNFKNIDTGLTFTYNSGDGLVDLSVTGNVIYDETGIDISIDIVNNGQAYSVQATYFNSNIYLNMGDVTYKFDPSAISATGDVDLMQMFGFVMSNLNLDLSFVGNLESYLGVDFSNFDINELVGKMDTSKSKELNGGGYDVRIDFGSAISVQILCDENFNIILAQTNKINNQIKFVANVNRMNDVDVSTGEESEVLVFYDETEDNVVDLSGMAVYAGYAENFFKTNLPLVKLNLDVQGTEVEATLQIDGQNVKLNASALGADLTIVHYEGVIYLDVLGLKLSFELSDYAIWKDEIDAILKEQLGKTSNEVLSEIVNKFVSEMEGEIENSNGSTLVAKILGALFSVDSDAQKYLPNSALMSDDLSEYVLSWADGTEVEFNAQDELISYLKVMHNKFSLEATFEQATNGIEIGEDEKEGYYNVSNLLPLADVVNRILSAKQFGGKISFEFTDGQLEGDYVVDFKGENVQAQFTCIVLGERVEVFVDGCDIYVVVGEVIVAGNINEIDKYLNRINNIFGTDLTLKKDESEKGDIKQTIVELVGAISKIFGNTDLSKDQDVTLIVKYLSEHFVEISVMGDLDGDVMKFHTAQISYHYGDLKVTVTMSDSNNQIEIPQDEQIDDDVLNVLSKIESVNKIIEERKVAFEFEINVQGETVQGYVQLDLESKVFELEISDVHIIYVENVAYVTIGEQKFKVEVDTAKGLFNIVSQVLKENFDVEIPDESENESDEENLSIWELMQKISLKVMGSTEDLKLGITYDETTLVLNLVFNGNELKQISFKTDDVFAVMTIATAREIEFADEGFYDLLSAQKGELTIEYAGATFVVEIELDLTDKVYVHAKTKVFGEDVEFVVLDNMAYLNLGDLHFGTNLNDAKSLVESVVKLFNITINGEKFEQDLQIADILKKLLTFDVSVFSEYGFHMSGKDLTYSYSNENVEIVLAVATLGEGETLTYVTAPATFEDISIFLPKVKNLYDWIRSGIYEFAFDASYNDRNFNVAGTFKYFHGNFEISMEEVCGVDLVIRMQDGTLYFTYGSMGFKYVVPTDSKPTDIMAIIEKLMSDEMSVKIDFGVFKGLLSMLLEYKTLSDWMENIIVDISGTTDNLRLTISERKIYSSRQLAKLEIAFEDDKLNEITLNVLDILNAELKIDFVESSTLPDFDERMLKYSDDFVSAMMSSLKVGKQNVYALSSNIAVRYSTSTFYGELVVMLVPTDEGEYELAVSLSTSSLQLSSYIYMIGQTIYIDIQGLQVQADLNKTTIDEILNFVKDHFGEYLTNEDGSSKLDGLEETMGALSVILPAIDQLHGAWVVDDATGTFGVQLSTADELWHGQSSNFSDIIIRAFLQNYEQVIMPTKLIIGANVTDANTEKHDADYYKDYLLNIEESSTSALNFAVYLTNISVGKYVEQLPDVFVSGDEYQTIDEVKSNYGHTALDDFNSYETMLDVVEATYEYVMNEEMSYQIGLSGSVVSDTTNILINSGTTVVVDIGDLEPDAELPQGALKFFDGKYLDVQGNLDVNLNGVRHLIDLFYGSKSEGFYLTYKHGDLIGVDDFKAFIANTSMSDITGMILAFANIELDPTTIENFGISENTTDFEFLQGLLGIGETDMSDTRDEMDQILDSVENFTKMISNINLSRSVEDDGTMQTTFSISLKLGEGHSNTIKILVEGEENEGVVTQSLKQIEITDLAVGGYVINLAIDIQQFTKDSFTYDTKAAHINFSDIASFVDVAVSTINTKNFNFSGKAQVKIGFSLTVGIDLYVSISDDMEIYFYMELDVPSFVDVTYNAGGAGETYSCYSSYGFDKRISTLEYKDGVLTVTQNTYGNKKFWYAAWKKEDEAPRVWTHTSDQIGSNIMLIMAQALGFTDSVYKDIKGLIDKMNPNPSLEQTILSFGFDSAKNQYSLGLDGPTLTGSNFDDLDVLIGVSNVSEQFTVGGKKFQFIDSISTTLSISIVNIPVTLNSVGGEQYTTGYGKVLKTNNYWRKEYLKKFAA